MEGGSALPSSAAIMDMVRHMMYSVMYTGS
jgi:hypothetical protein